MSRNCAAADGLRTINLASLEAELIWNPVRVSKELSQPAEVVTYFAIKGKLFVYRCECDVLFAATDQSNRPT